MIKKRIDAKSLELKERVVAINRVSKVVKGGKRFKFAVLVVVGDGDRYVGAGIGKAKEISEAVRKGIDKASIISLVVITAIAIPNTRIAERFHAAKDEIKAYVKHDNGSTSVGARFDMWKSALLMAQEKPLFGWGSEQIIEERKKQHQKGLISQYAIQFNHAHNQFLDDLSKRGLFGLIALLGIYFIPLIFFIKNIANDVLKIRTVAVLGAVHCLSVMGYSLSQGFLTHNSGNIFYFFLVVVFYTLLNHLKTNPAQTA